MNGKINPDWEIAKIKDIGKVITGKTPPTSNKTFFNGKYPFIKIPDMNNSVYLSFSESSLSEEGASHMKNLILPPDSVMVSCLATIGKVGITTKESFTNQQINSIIPNKKIISPLWIYYFFKNNKNYLESLGGGGSVYINISKTKFENAVIPLPPLPEQLAIASILSSLDAKIELNNKMNKTLEAIGQALFKKWFVENPEKDNWKEGKLGDIVKLKMGISPKGESYNETETGVPLLNGAADFSGKLIIPKKFTSAPIKMCDVGDLIFCIRATIGNITFADKKYCLGRGVAALEIQKGYREFVYYLLNSSLEEMVSGAYGSVIKGLSKIDIENLKITIPDKETILNFNKICFPIFEKQFSLDKQNQTLSQIRDALLPKLMSGEVRVSLCEENIK